MKSFACEDSIFFSFFRFIEISIEDHVLNQEDKPSVLMEFNVEAELQDIHGNILRREITTQTTPIRKVRTTTRKRKVSF